MEEPQPGQVIVPRSDEQARPPEPTPAEAQAVQPTPQPLPPSPEPIPVVPVEQPAPSPQPTAAPAAPHSLAENAIVWEAEEFAAQAKTSTWYGVTVLGSILLSLIIYLLNRDIITSALVLVALTGLAYFSGRKPRIQQYAVDGHGVQVGRNFYAYQDFKGFSIVDEGSHSSIALTPLKRFMPQINIFLPNEYVEAVSGLIAQILPVEQHKTSTIDNFMNKIKF